MSVPTISAVTLAQASALLVVVWIVGELGRMVVRYLFKKLTREDYLLRGECEKCSDGRTKASEKKYAEFDKVINEVMARLFLIQGILLVLATKGEIPLEKIDELVNRNHG